MRKLPPAISVMRRAACPGSAALETEAWAFCLRILTASVTATAPTAAPQITRRNRPDVDRCRPAMANLLVCAQRKDSDMDAREVNVNALPAREGAHCGRKNKRFVKFRQTQVERSSSTA